MGNNELAKQLIATYERHGWHLHSALAREENCDEFQQAFPGIKVEQAFLNALWFFRPSTSNREAWELRLLSEVPYALFETFDVDADETFKESIRAEMVHKMSERMV